MKKKIVCLALVIAVILCGCSSSNTPDTSQTDNTGSAVDNTAADSDTVREVQSDKIVEEYNNEETFILLEDGLNEYHTCQCDIHKIKNNMYRFYFTLTLTRWRRI